MSQILGTFSSTIHGRSGQLKITSSGVTFEDDKPDGYIEEKGFLGKNSNKKVSDSIIEDAKQFSDESGKIVCVFDISDKVAFSTKIASKEEKREIKIDSLFYEDFFLETEDLFSDYPSIMSYYDTETDRTDILTRHQIVMEFLKSIGFETNSLNFGYHNIEMCTKLETSYTSKDIPRVIIRVEPNLMIKLIILPEGYDTNKEFRFFFNRNRIINEISKITPISWKRDQKIDKLLNIN
jgi:hypothetical protein